MVWSGIFEVALCGFRPGRRRHGGADGRGRRFADDAAAGAAVRHPSGDGGGHGSSLRRPDQDRGSTVHGANTARSNGGWCGVWRSAARRWRSSRCWRSSISAASRGHANSAITATLGIALLLTSVSLLFRPWLVAGSEPLFERHVRPPDGGLSPWRSAAALGVLVSISSVGAGAIGVTVLLMLYPNMPTLRIVGSDIAHAVPLTLIAGAGHWCLGSVDWSMLLSLLIGSIPGVAIASHFAGARARQAFTRVARRRAGAGRGQAGVSVEDGGETATPKSWRRERRFCA